MESSGCVPNFGSRFLLIAALCEEGKMGKAEELWKEIRFRGLKLDTVLCSFMIRGYCKSGEMMKAEELYREMRFDACSDATYESLINGYCRVADIDSAMLIYNDMRRNGCRPEGLTLETLITGLYDKGMILEALKTMNHGVCPTEKCYELLIKGLCMERKMEEALKLRAEMVGNGFKPNLDFYDALIEGYLSLGNEEMVTMLRKEAIETQKEEEEN
ncbi:hypothetical protein PTKIN_Ptkin10aG0184500 [Pterospermum kingtungense]